jgi:hypothetical protein
MRKELASAMQLADMIASNIGAVVVRKDHANGWQPNVVAAPKKSALGPDIGRQGIWLQGQDLRTSDQAVERPSGYERRAILGCAMLPKWLVRRIAVLRQQFVPSP